MTVKRNPNDHAPGLTKIIRWLETGEKGESLKAAARRKRGTKKVTTPRKDDAISRGFDKGNYAGGYETQDLTKAVAKHAAECKKSQAWCDGFVLGFFASYGPLEIPAKHRRDWNEARKRQYRRAKRIGLAI